MVDQETRACVFKAVKGVYGALKNVALSVHSLVKLDFINMSTWGWKLPFLSYFTGSLKSSVTAPSEINERAELELLGVKQNSRQ